MHAHCTFLMRSKYTQERQTTITLKQKWLVNTFREYALASQSEHVPQSCFYVKVECLTASIV